MTEELKEKEVVEATSEQLKPLGSEALQPEAPTVDPRKYRRQLANAHLYLHRNGAGQTLAHLMSRNSPESTQVFNEINELLKAKLSFSSENALEELCKQNSAFHRKLTLEALVCVAELQAQLGASS